MSAGPAGGGAGAAEAKTRARVAVVIALHVPLAAGFAFGLVRDLVTPASVAATDFTVFWTGWWLLLHGQAGALYDAAAQRAAQRVLMGGVGFEGGLMAFISPPHAALAGLPLGWLADHAGERAALAVFAAVNLALVARLDRLLRDLLGVGASGRVRWMTTLLLLAFYPVFFTISVGQISLLLAVATLELHRALAAHRPGRAAAWLMVLSLKPQLLPPLLLFLAVRRRWGVLARAAGIAAALAVLTALALRWRIWIDYARAVKGLESFFGSGTPAYMMNVRGALTRLLGGVAGPEAIYAASIAAWLAAMAALVVALVKGRGADLRDDLALVLAVTLLMSPHLFVQDAVIWPGVLALHLAAARARGARWRPFAAFALAWPLLFAIARVADLGAQTGTRPGIEPRLWIDPAVVAMIVATVAIARYRQLGSNASSPA